MRMSRLAMSVLSILLPAVCGPQVQGEELLAGGALLTASRMQSTAVSSRTRSEIAAPVETVRTAGLFGNLLGLPVPQQWQGQRPTGRPYAANGSSNYRGAGMSSPNCPNGNCPQAAVAPYSSGRPADQWQAQQYRSGSSSGNRTDYDWSPRNAAYSGRNASPARSEIDRFANDVYSTQYNPQDFNLRQQYNGNGQNLPCRACASGQCPDCANGQCQSCANGQPCNCPTCAGLNGNCANGQCGPRSGGMSAPRGNSQFAPRNNNQYLPANNGSSYGNPSYGYPDRRGENRPMNSAPQEMAGGVARI